MTEAADDTHVADGATAAAFIARWQGIAALSDGVTLGVLSSEVHRVWSLASGERMGVGNDPVYNKTRCFEPFPLPDLHAAEKFGGPIGVALLNPDGTTAKTETYGEYPSGRIRNLAEQLDAHRKRQQAAHPGLTLTGMYNVLEALRSGQRLTAKERAIHEQGLVSVLRQLHDELDEAVLYAYGWGDLLPLLRVAHGTAAPDESISREDAKRSFDEVILERLVALNAERAAEEARGLVRWLRPEFQNPELAREREPEQARLTTGRDAPSVGADEDEPVATPVFKPQPWPKDAVDQVRAPSDVLASSPVPLSVEEVAARFTARGRVEETAAEAAGNAGGAGKGAGARGCICSGVSSTTGRMRLADRHDTGTGTDHRGPGC